MFPPSFAGHFGKYLNEYDGSWVPVGWKRWEGLLHNSKFYNYTLRHNTYKERHKMSYEHDYFTDLITNRSISFIRRTKATRPDSPFLAVLSHSAPHGPETAAPQYSTAFPDAKAPRYIYDYSGNHKPRSNVSVFIFKRSFLHRFRKVIRQHVAFSLLLFAGFPTGISFPRTSSGS